MKNASAVLDQAEKTAEDQIETAKEGAKKVKKFTEDAASKTPTLLFLYGALAAIAVSAFLQMRGKRHISLFIGEWAPSLLLFGLYNKLLKTAGGD